MRYLYHAGFLSLVILSTSCARHHNNSNVIGETYVHKYGVAVPSDFWTASGEHGNVISTMANGVIINKSYTSGNLDGETTYSYPHSSQINKIETYSQGILVKETEFFFDGTSKKETTHNYPVEGTVTVKTWYLGGVPKSVEEYKDQLLVNGDYYSSLNHKDASVQNYAGNRLIRDDYGMLLETDEIEGGQRVLLTLYHPNGSPMEITQFKDGAMDGMKKTYYPAGEPNVFESYKGGLQDGTTVVFLHGDKYAEVPYVNGLKQGIEKRYRDGSTLVQEISWDKGVLHGPTKSYIGETTTVDWYFRGQPVTKTSYDFMVNRPVQTIRIK